MDAKFSEKRIRGSDMLVFWKWFAYVLNEYFLITLRKYSWSVHGNLMIQSNQFIIIIIIIIIIVIIIIIILIIIMYKITYIWCIRNKWSYNKL